MVGGLTRFATVFVDADYDVRAQATEDRGVMYRTRGQEAWFRKPSIRAVAMVLAEGGRLGMREKLLVRGLGLSDRGWRAGCHDPGLTA